MAVSNGSGAACTPVDSGVYLEQINQLVAVLADDVAELTNSATEDNLVAGDVIKSTTTSQHLASCCRQKTSNLVAVGEFTGSYVRIDVVVRQVRVGVVEVEHLVETRGHSSNSTIANCFVTNELYGVLRNNRIAFRIKESGLKSDEITAPVTLIGDEVFDKISLDNPRNQVQAGLNLSYRIFTRLRIKGQKDLDKVSSAIAKTIQDSTQDGGDIRANEVIESLIIQEGTDLINQAGNVRSASNTCQRLTLKDARFQEGTSGQEVNSRTTDEASRSLNTILQATGANVISKSTE